LAGAFRLSDSFPGNKVGLKKRNEINGFSLSLVSYLLRLCGATATVAAQLNHVLINIALNQFSSVERKLGLRWR
jgi:hypothetical protein